MPLTPATYLKTECAEARGLNRGWDGKAIRRVTIAKESGSVANWTGRRLSPCWSGTAGRFLALGVATVPSFGDDLCEVRRRVFPDKVTCIDARKLAERLTRDKIFGVLRRHECVMSTGEDERRRRDLRQ